MNIASVSVPRALISEPSSFETIKNNLSNPRNWAYLIPTISAIVTGVMLVPNFTLGLAAGGATSVAVIPIALFLKAVGLRQEEEDSDEYEREIHDRPILTTMATPLLEEGIFRGGMQPLVTRAIIWLVPAAAASFMGTALSVALVASIVVTASLFGAMHYTNPHKNAHIQAIVTTADGLILGLLAAQFGIGASIAAHIAHNTLIVTLERIFCNRNNATDNPRFIW